jgi:hypothetical protein
MWKAVRWYLLVAVIALASGFLLGRAGTGATAAQKQSRDSLALVSAALDRAVHVADSIRAKADSIAAANVALAAAASKASRAKTDTAWLTIEKLVPDTGALRRAVQAGEAAVLAERTAGDRHVATLEADTTQKAGDLRTALKERDAYHAQRDDAQKQLDAALARRTEPPVTLGATLGPGCLLTGGRVVCGYAGANAGLTVRIRIPLPKFLGG